jgi:hypothetical protein
MTCRIQECTRQLGQEQVKVQLWDVAGGSQFQNYWELLSKVRAATLPSPGQCVVCQG